MSNHMSNASSTSQPASPQAGSLAIEPLSTGSLVAALLSIGELLPIAVALWNAAQEPLYQNRLAGRLFGTDEPFKIEIVGASDQPDWMEQIRIVAQKGESRIFGTTRCICADSIARSLDLSFHPLRLDKTTQHGALLLAQDLSREQDLENQVAHSAGLAAVGRLAARVAHELNNPLDGSLRYVNLARRAIETGQTGKLDEYLSKSTAGMKRMAEIITDLLEFSRGAPDAEHDRNVNWIVEEAIHMMREPADTNEVIIAACLGNEDRMPSVGGTKLLQVCGNLIRNAIDAMPNGGRLTITSGIVNNDIIIRFEDTGTGLPDDVEQLFKPFHTTKSAGKGTGLGLAISREYIDQLGGTISGANNASAGATFLVQIPIQQTDPHQTIAKDPSPKTVKESPQ
jgi:signal transduction histidine kinase